MDEHTEELEVEISRDSEDGLDVQLNKSDEKEEEEGRSKKVREFQGLRAEDSLFEQIESE